MGSRPNTDISYIAGFLDGDGSLMLQLKKRSDSKKGLRFMSTICFYQDSRHDKPLSWIRKILGIGYLSRRNDGISELRINGFKQTHKVLKILSPYIRFKKEQARITCRALELLEKKTLKQLTKSELRKVVRYIIAIQNYNYTSSRKKTKKDLEKLLGLTP